MKKSDKKSITVKTKIKAGGVSAIDSSGIGEMVACYTTITK